ncbi:hypothetical protein ACPXCV_27470, partial [Escherichia coli]|uniref:hypothetical protein n=1 Tax=Escherichia coli TaxID=562 RepID=UPI003CE59273
NPTRFWVADQPAAVIAAQTIPKQSPRLVQRAYVTEKRALTNRIGGQFAGIKADFGSSAMAWLNSSSVKRRIG